MYRPLMYVHESIAENKSFLSVSFLQKKTYSRYMSEPGRLTENLKSSDVIEENKTIHIAPGERGQSSTLFYLHSIKGFSWCSLKETTKKINKGQQNMQIIKKNAFKNVLCNW